MLYSLAHVTAALNLQRSSSTGAPPKGNRTRFIRIVIKQRH
jgi:hypothetical protein